MLQNLKSEMGVLVINEGDLDSAQGQGLVVGGQTVWSDGGNFWPQPPIPCGGGGQKDWRLKQPVANVSRETAIKPYDR